MHSHQLVVLSEHLVHKLPAVLTTKNLVSINGLVRRRISFVRLRRCARRGICVVGASGPIGRTCRNDGCIERLFDLLFRKTEMKVSRAGQLAFLSLHFVGHVEFQEFQLNNLGDMSFHAPS